MSTSEERSNPPARSQWPQQGEINSDDLGNHLDTEKESNDSGQESVALCSSEDSVTANENEQAGDAVMEEEDMLAGGSAEENEDMLAGNPATEEEDNMLAVLFASEEYEMNGNQDMDVVYWSGDEDEVDNYSEIDEDRTEEEQNWADTEMSDTNSNPSSSSTCTDGHMQEEQF
ncbi:uncharacterized protein PGTG_20837 [Puccinia graminis f. sp. tritici CRL 75-36-700-3]|uniref:Uncharacterized protein n=1 Tax=Puccinia graminis f. sp. tritici (strain CRL 75-36-700-3 / race SCCL) TaxID=418459 RepID=H6QPN8_PUCGT|nr:uncharacterized protein PGTG_20837 [Puccinia graminis f. sp. tritici CRL 75-36-700-3]EHS64140.1 hypothetical protein PGTG_20837 [Puccinia graminis f. sp. tritici CRL 75-36-700-3]